MIIPIGEEKASNKIQYPIITTLSKPGKEKNLLNLIKAMQPKPTANNIYLVNY